MCTHSRFIFNRYSQKRVLVKCGKCPACLQEKACARANRIRNNFTNGTIALFLTLTYDNRFVPYVKRQQIVGRGDLVIYRDSQIRYVHSCHGTELRVFDDVQEIGCIPQDECFIDGSSDLRPLTHSNHRIGVCWYPDIQNFFKRLRIILKRHYNYEKYFSYFSCSEYGGHTYRPHFHALLFIPSVDEEIFRSAILEAWPYADKSRTAKFIEIAWNASSYVASYVNSNSSLYPLLSCDFFKQKHSQSKNFGVILDCFSLTSILQKIESGNLVYYSEQKFDGSSSVVPLPIPLYVLYRYFPYCKGFNRLSPCQLCSILLSPDRTSDFLSEHKTLVYHDVDNSLLDVDFNGVSRFYSVISSLPKLDNPLYHFTPKECYQIYVRLENAFKKFHLQTGLSRYDYAFYYQRAFDVYRSQILKLSHEDISFVDDYSDFYENAFEVFDNPAIAPTLNPDNLQLDPNKRSSVIEKSNRFSTLFYKMNKQRKVTNYCMSEMDYNV